MQKSVVTPPNFQYLCATPEAMRCGMPQARVPHTMHESRGLGACHRQRSGDKAAYMDHFQSHCGEVVKRSALIFGRVVARPSFRMTIRGCSCYHLGDGVPLGLHLGQSWCVALFPCYAAALLYIIFTDPP